MAKNMIKTIPISKLLINPKNPRFSPVSNQDEAVQLMLDREGLGIKNLAKDIAHHGINPTKIPAVLSKNGKFLTLEGNRRMLVLKLLDDPKKTNDQAMREFFYNLKAKNPGHIVDKIPCRVFEDEDDVIG